MIDLKEFQALKKKSEDAKAEADRAAGALEQHLKTLKEDFDCESLEEGEKLLENLKKNLDDLEKQYATALEEFKSKWGHIL